MPLFRGPLGAVSIGRVQLQGEDRTALLRELPQLPPSEMTGAARAFHPQVCPALGVATSRGLSFIASDFFAGASLFELIELGMARGVAVDVRVAAHIARQALETCVAVSPRARREPENDVWIHSDTVWIRDGGAVCLTEIDWVRWLSPRSGAARPVASNARAAAELFCRLLGAGNRIDVGGARAPSVPRELARISSGEAARAGELIVDEMVLAALDRIEPADDAEVAALLQGACAAELVERRAFQRGRVPSLPSSAHDESTAAFRYPDEQTQLYPEARVRVSSARAESARRERNEPRPERFEITASAPPPGRLEAFPLFEGTPHSPEDLSEVTHVFRASEIPPSRAERVSQPGQARRARRARRTAFMIVTIVVLVFALVWLG